MILLLSSLLVLPFLFGIDLSELKMIEMSINLNKTVISSIFQKTKEFESYIKRNSYLTLRDALNNNENMLSEEVGEEANSEGGDD